MQERSELGRARGHALQVTDRGISPEDRNLLAAVPGQSSRRSYRSDMPAPAIYREALRVMLGTPEIQGRLPYVTASLIVTIFGTWLAVKAIQTRAFALAADIVLFLCTTALAGFLVGVLLGEGILTTKAVPFLLSAAVAFVLLLSVILVADMLLGRRSRHEASTDGAEQEIVVRARPHRSYSERTKPV
ncbi:MAG: hypothetical protein M1482_14230 [Chloroflexi bacterium]|nr:hypothetical protein [Chloroflexota bacterium]